MLSAIAHQAAFVGSHAPPPKIHGKDHIELTRMNNQFDPASSEISNVPPSTDIFNVLASRFGSSGNVSMGNGAFVEVQSSGDDIPSGNYTQLRAYASANSLTTNVAVSAAVADTQTTSAAATTEPAAVTEPAPAPTSDPVVPPANGNGNGNGHGYGRNK